MISTPLSSALQSPFSSSGNPWNLNPTGPLPTPFMGEPSSWPPLTSSSSFSSQMHAAVTASATADPEATADVPAVAVDPISDPSPVTAPEPEPIPDQERTALPEELQAVLRHSSAPPRADPNHQGSRNRHKNSRPHEGRGRTPHFFHSGNGGKFYRPPPPYWNPVFGFDQFWPPHAPAGGPPPVPLDSGPPLNYDDANLSHHQGSFNPGLIGPVYHLHPLTPGLAPGDLGPRPTSLSHADDDLAKDVDLNKQMDDQGWVDIQTTAILNKMHAAVTASATADPEATADVPAVAIEPISDPSPVTAPEPEPIPDQEWTTLPEELEVTPRHSSAPPRADPNHQGSRNRHDNSRPHQGKGRGRGRGRGPHFFHSGNGGKFYRPPPPYWNPTIGFGQFWPPHPPTGAPPVPFQNGAPLNYYDANLPRYHGSFNPGLSGPVYHPLPPGAAPGDLGPRPPPLTEDQKAQPEYRNLLEEPRLQIEYYYFSDDNLAKDAFLKKQMDDQGWVDIQTTARFNKMHATVTASATADPEATADVPAVAVEAISYPSPVTAPECDPIPDQERTALPEESDAAPRHSSARDPNHQRNSNRHNNRRPQQGRGRDPHFFHSGNGGKFYRPPPPYWNPAFGFGPIWPPHPPAGAPPLVPLYNGPPLNYHDANLPHYQGSFNPGLSGLVYDLHPLPPSAAPGDLGPRSPPLTEDQKVELPLTEDQKAELEYQNLLEELRLQIEYYFSDDNLARDVYLKRQMDDQGWVDIQTIAKFNKVAAKTTDLEVICKALSSSDNVELQEDKIRKKDGWNRFCLPKY